MSARMADSNLALPDHLRVAHDKGEDRHVVDQKATSALIHWALHRALQKNSSPVHPGATDLTMWDSRSATMSSTSMPRYPGGQAQARMAVAAPHMRGPSGIASPAPPGTHQRGATAQRIGMSSTCIATPIAASAAQGRGQARVRSGGGHLLG